MIQLSSIVKSKQTRIELVTRPDPEQLAVAGGISGVLTTVIMAPGERIKCILQVRVFCEVVFLDRRVQIHDECPLGIAQPSLTCCVHVIVGKTRDQ